MSECCVLSDRGLCNELITHPEEFYRLWCFVVCDQETSKMRRPWPTGGCRATNKQTNKSWTFNRLRKVIKQQNRQCVFDVRVGRIRFFFSWNIFRYSEHFIYCGKSFCCGSALRSLLLLLLRYVILPFLWITLIWCCLC